MNRREVFMLVSVILAVALFVEWAHRSGLSERLMLGGY